MVVTQEARLIIRAFSHFAIPVMLSLMMAAERHGNVWPPKITRGGFDKLGPVISLPDGYTGHVRDPKVWKHNSQWYMVLGAQDKEKRGKCCCIPLSI